jgi:5'(3')-deoxyribonucleotidase
MQRQFVFGVDLDGVCANFYGGLRPIAAEWLGVDVQTLPTEVSYGLPEWRIPEVPGGYLALHKFAVTQRDLFRVLNPIPGAPQVLRTLSVCDVRIRIITHRLFIKYFHLKAIEQTIAWLDHHDIPHWDLCFMKEKAAVGADLYIDDAPRNVENLRAEGLTTIIFTNSTNRAVEGLRADTWKDVERIVLEHKAKWSSESGLPGT